MMCILSITTLESLFKTTTFPLTLHENGYNKLPEINVVKLVPNGLANETACKKFLNTVNIRSCCY